MANKYSKKNNSTTEKKVAPAEEHRKGYGKGARIMAIVLIVVMVIFTVVAAGLFVLD